MKKIKYKTLLILFAVLLIVIIFVYTIISHKVDTDLDYCKALARNLGWLNTKQYHCKCIDIGDNEQTILIDFRLKSYDNYSNCDGHIEAIYDIGMIKKEISKYLEKFPDHELNKKRIICTFYNLPGEQCYMYNFDNRLKKNLQKPDGLRYFQWITIDITKADDFKDACDISLAVNNKNELQFLEEWKNLKYLELVGMDFSEEDKKYLVEILPNCTIYCNKERISS